MPDQEEVLVRTEMDINTLRLIHFALNQSLQKWCGSEPYDQTHIRAARDAMYTCLMDVLLTTEQI